MAAKKTWGWMRERYKLAPATDPDGEDLEYNDKVNMAKDAIRAEVGDDFNALRARFDAACDAYDEMKKLEQQVNLEYEACERLMMDRARALGIADGFKTEAFTYSVKLTPHPNVDDKEQLRQWMVDQGREKELSLHWQSLKGMVVEALGPGGSRVLPAGVSVWVKESVSRLKRNNGKRQEDDLDAGGGEPTPF